MKTLAHIAMSVSLALAATSLVASAGCKKKEDEPKKPDIKPDIKPDTRPDTRPDTEPVGDKSLAPVTATAELKPTEGSKAAGTITLTSDEEGKVTIVADVNGLEPGDHGFHIHETGDCSAPDGKSAGGHFNPGKTDHGAPDSPAHHTGDLGNLTADDKGVARATMTVDFVTLGHGASDAIGKAFIVHAKSDDFKTQPTGDAGARVACGVIARK